MTRIAMLSVHACPLAKLGGRDSGGMNVYVRELARELGRRGVEVDVFTRWREKDDLLKKESQLRSVRDAYMSEARRLGLTVYDWTGGGLPLLASPGALPTTMTGYRNAEILFVGERAGKKTIVWDLPFHNTTGSARYLWDALQLVRGWEERRGAWLNAYASDETSRDLATSIKTLPRLRKVIALGERAAEACHAQGVKVHPVPHPQYWRRFHHNNVNDYAELLEAAIR